MSLSEKQKEFCKHYIDCNDGRMAAILAGYSEKTASTTAKKLLINNEIIEQIKNKNNHEIDRNFVINKLVELLDRCLEAKPVTKWDASKKENVETGVYTFDSRGAIKALEQLAKYLGMEQDKTASNENAVVNIIDDIK